MKSLKNIYGKFFLIEFISAFIVSYTGIWLSVIKPNFIFSWDKKILKDPHKHKYLKQKSIEIFYNPKRKSLESKIGKYSNNF